MRILTLAAAGLLALAGCSDKQPKFDELHPVNGTVTAADGKPVSGGSVQFTPDPDKPEFLVNSEVSKAGSFSLSTVRTTDSRGERKKGAPAGKYKVVFRPDVVDQTQGHKEPITLPEPVTVEAKSNDLKLALPKGR